MKKSAHGINSVCTSKLAVWHVTVHDCKMHFSICFPGFIGRNRKRRKMAYPEDIENRLESLITRVGEKVNIYIITN